VLHLFSARYLLPVGCPLIEEGSLLVENGLICAVGPRRELAAAHPGAAAIDFGEAVILPPLTNAHTHLELTDFPVWAQEDGVSRAPAGFVDWILRLVNVRKTIAPERLRTSLAAGLRASLAGGVGAVGDILTTLTAAAAYPASPLRGRVFCEVLGREVDQVTSRLEEIKALTASPCAAGMSWGISPHAPYTLNNATAEKIGEFAVQNNLPIAMHLAETKEEVAFLETTQGPIANRLYAVVNWPLTAAPYGRQRPVAWADRHACLPQGSLVVHGVHVNESEISTLAIQDCSVALCPRSNSVFGSARAPLAGYRAAGVNLALGTDSMASVPSLSIWDEMAFARHWYAGVLSPAEWLEIATLGGARALGLEHAIGSLTPRKEASFQVVGVPSGATTAGLEEALCEQGQDAMVHEVYLSGRPVLGKNRESALTT
jgi:cytosine/adenosine deaminase-related metal-dependent hydrolase